MSETGPHSSPGAWLSEDIGSFYVIKEAASSISILLIRHTAWFSLCL